MKEAGVLGSACDVSNRIGSAGTKKAILVTSRNRTGENGKATNAIDIVGLIDSY
jgi:hypothetical protein